MNPSTPGRNMQPPGATVAASPRHCMGTPPLGGSCLVCRLRETLPGTDLVHDVRPHSWPAHSAIYQQGQSLGRVHAVCAGLGALQQTSPHGGDRTLRLIEPGDVIGLEGLTGRVAQSQAIALTTTHTCCMRIDLLLATARHTPWLAAELHALWLRALTRADFVIAGLSTGPARARVARLLAHLCDLSGPSHVPDLSRHDMASLMALTTETVSRTMAALQREGAVQSRGALLICRPDVLKMASELD